MEQALSALPRSDESFTWEAVPYAEEAVPYAEAFRLPSEVVETEAAAGRIAAEGYAPARPAFLLWYTASGFQNPWPVPKKLWYSTRKSVKINSNLLSSRLALGES